ncbi:hypothetical protein [Methanobrevibacter thaueri]|uniref:Uncharacterized protein n=1 Tax=Methanobrevibacter thaueri TaxID=190975 RepID=A0A315XPM3_9EURY|nr:hypothetical protein [Methanobrevibacter thaueri]PWB88315.1 hypothetical protein MBBTH_00460 [Methanobrevibacter thaueri]
MRMEIEFTDEQAKKVDILKENGIGVGDAIDMLFDLKETFADTKLNQAQDKKDKLEEELAKIDKEISMYNQMKEGSLDPSLKVKIIEKEYGTVEKTYDESVQDAKHKFKWTNILKV